VPSGLQMISDNGKIVSTSGSPPTGIKLAPTAHVVAMPSRTADQELLGIGTPFRRRIYA